MSNQELAEKLRDLVDLAYYWEEDSHRGITIEELQDLLIEASNKLMGVHS